MHEPSLASHTEAALIEEKVRKETERQEAARAALVQEMEGWTAARRDAFERRRAARLRRLMLAYYTLVCVRSRSSCSRTTRCWCACVVAAHARVLHAAVVRA